MKAYFTPNMGSYVAGADLSAAQYHFVKAGTVINTVVVCSAVTDIPVGILMNAPLSGETADVALPGGGAKLAVTGVIAPGARVGTSATGTGLSVDGVTGACSMGVADSIGANSASGDTIPVFLTGPALRKAADAAAVAATAASTAGGSTPTAAQVDTGIATAVASIVTGVNAIRTALINAGIMA